MKKNDRTEVLIEGYSSEGYGVAKPDGYVLFIPETVCGERVLALGSDFDGCDPVLDIASADKMPALQEHLEQRFGAEVTEALCGGNALAFFERFGR